MAWYVMTREDDSKAVELIEEMNLYREGTKSWKVGSIQFGKFASSLPHGGIVGCARAAGISDSDAYGHVSRFKRWNRGRFR